MFEQNGMLMLNIVNKYDCPVRNAQVKLANSYVYEKGCTDNSGNVIIRCIPFGDYILTVGRAQYKTSINLLKMRNKCFYTKIVLEARVCKRIYGKIVEENGKCVRYADVILYGDYCGELIPLDRTQTSNRGFYEFTNVPPGKYLIKSNKYKEQKVDIYEHLKQGFKYEVNCNIKEDSSVEDGRYDKSKKCDIFRSGHSVKKRYIRRKYYTDENIHNEDRIKELLRKERRCEEILKGRSVNKKYIRKKYNVNKEDIENRSKNRNTINKKNVCSYWSKCGGITNKKKCVQCSKGNEMRIKKNYNIGKEYSKNVENEKIKNKKSITRRFMRRKI